MSVVGLMVYNIATLGDGSTIYPSVYTWDGEKWATSQANPSKMEAASQPKAFTFYETGLETVQPLTFSVSGATGAVTYQWYQVTGTNVHVRVGTAIPGTGTITGTGQTTASFTPTGVIKTTNSSKSTKYAQNNGFYRFYCEATDSYGRTLVSDIAEVAVGCGAKNNDGEWISFLCFNLGADQETIAAQKGFSFGPYEYNSSTYIHSYVTGEEKVWGDLFQWGRIPDGHEKRTSTVVGIGAMAASDIVNGSRCSASDTQRPYQQIKKGTTWFGKFITTTSATDYNWTPIAQSAADQLWRNSRFMSNDPCAHFKADRSYQEFWHEGTDQTSTGIAACTDAGTSWRTPTHEEWGAIYKGGVSGGSNTTATANTWKWYSLQGGSTGLTQTRGFEIQPDNATTTLFLPANGYRAYNTASLYYQGTACFYWSTSFVGTNAYCVNFNSASVMPAYSSNRALGFALRCVKNS
jgi:hypothetical protein